MNRMLRRLCCGILTAVFLALAALPACAEQDNEIELYARSAVLMDGDSGRILYAKEADTELPMASTTKIMTCILALEVLGTEARCTVSEYAASQPPVKLGMTKGDSFYLKDLLYSLMLESHNDTAVCIAENVSGSVEAFAQRMNEKAAELGCRHTHYITPNGLDASDGAKTHHTTAAELARVMRYCLTQSPQAEAFLQITGAPSHAFANAAGTRSYSCTNHNALLTMMDGAISGKTGFTGKAGYCYVGALRRGGKLLIVSLLACGWPNQKGRKWVDTKKLMNYGLEQYEKRSVAKDSIQVAPVSVLRGQKAAVRIEAVLPPEGTILQILMKPQEQLQMTAELPKALAAPVKKGTRIGTVRCLLDGGTVAAFPVRAAETVERRDYAYVLKGLVNQLLLRGGRQRLTAINSLKTPAGY